MSLIQALPPGPLDIVGDIHGEFDALEQLLAHLACARYLNIRQTLSAYGSMVQGRVEPHAIIRILIWLLTHRIWSAKHIPTFGQQSRMQG